MPDRNMYDEEFFRQHNQMNMHHGHQHPHGHHHHGHHGHHHGQHPGHHHGHHFGHQHHGHHGHFDPYGFGAPTQYMPHGQFGQPMHGMMQPGFGFPPMFPNG